MISGETSYEEILSFCSRFFADSPLQDRQPRARNGARKISRSRARHSKASGLIPRQYTCDGGDVSPPLIWKNAPAQTRALALIADDPDAPGGTWVHWVIYDLPAAANELAEGMAKGAMLASDAHQGLNDFGRIGYGGPCPPSGPAHRYFFKLYALDTETGLKPGASKTQLLDTIRGHVLGQAELMGRYGR